MMSRDYAILSIYVIALGVDIIRVLRRAKRAGMGRRDMRHLAVYYCLSLAGIVAVLASLMAFSVIGDAVFYSVAAATFAWISFTNAVRYLIDLLPISEAPS